jgi:hypothetical protein
VCCAFCRRRVENAAVDVILGLFLFCLLEVSAYTESRKFWENPLRSVCINSCPSSTLSAYAIAYIPIPFAQLHCCTRHTQPLV